MKKLALILSLFLLTGCAGMNVDKASMVNTVLVANIAAATDGGFRNSKWGMTPEEVIAAEGLVGAEIKTISNLTGTYKIETEQNTQARPIITTYNFEKNALENVKVAIKKIPTEQEGRLTYNQLRKELISRYGKPAVNINHIIVSTARWNLNNTQVDIFNTVATLVSPPAYKSTYYVTEQRSSGSFYTTERTVEHGGSGRPRTDGDVYISIRKQ